MIIKSKENLNSLLNYIQLKIMSYEKNVSIKKDINDILMGLGDYQKILSYDSYKNVYEEFGMYYSDLLVEYLEEAKKICLSNNISNNLSTTKNFDKTINDAQNAIFLLSCNEQNKSETLEYEGIIEAKSRIEMLKSIIKDCYITFSNELKLLNSKDNISDEEYNILKQIIYFIDNNHVFTSEMYCALSKMFEKDKIDVSSKIEWLENIKNYDVEISLNLHNARNKYAYNKAGNIQLDSRKDDVINMVRYGFEKLTPIYYDGDRKLELDNNIRTIIACEEKDLLLPSYDGNLTFKGNLDLNEYNYIMYKVLSYYQNELLNSVNDLKTEGTYDDKELRNICIKDFYDNFVIYDKIRNFELNQLELYNLDLQEKNKDESMYKLNYVASDGSLEKAYFESDIKNIPKDLYLTIFDMLVDFKQNGFKTKYNIKKLVDIDKLLELKNDQIRIFFTCSDANEFNIVGVFQKKQDKDRTITANIRNRRDEYLITDEAHETKILDSLYLNHHNGGRIK